MSNSNLVHFDEVEAELERTLRQMVSEFAKEDPSVRVPTNSMSEEVDLEQYFGRFSEPYATEFLKHLNSLGFEIQPELEENIREHFVSVVSEYDTVDTVVSAKVEDQTPELGVNALISEHKNPIMQMLQELDEGYSSGS